MGWHSENYFLKAQRYWERTTTAGRDAELFLLQMSFVVEFVIRGALASKNPSLNADLNEETLIFACGEKPNKSPISVGMDKAIQRIQRFTPEISTAEVQAARLLFETRNEELHSDNDALASVNDASLKPLILSFIVKLTKFAGQDIEVLLGKSDAQQAVTTSNALAKDRKDRVSNLIKISKDRFFGLSKDEQEEMRKEAKLGFLSAVMKTGHHVIAKKCPACSSDGLLGGSPIGKSAPHPRRR